MWNRAEIEEIVERLEFMRREILFQIIVSMKETVDEIALRRDLTIDDSDDATTTIIESIIASRSDLAAIITAQNDELIQRHIDAEAAATRRAKEDERRHEEVQAQLKLLLSMSIGASQIPDAQDMYRKIKSCLYFNSIYDRHDDIDGAHKQTFEWAFQKLSDRQMPSSDLSRWLRDENGVYWVSGKAGSGKSTLMKFLDDDVRLRDALKQWAKSETLVIISHYFWNTGSELQKSQEGLFRSILLGALDQCPELAPILFPEVYRLGAELSGPPSFHELRRAFRRLTTQDEIPIRLTMLIDGLDEFEPTDISMTEIAHMFLSASQSKNVKVLLSSRPLSAFEAAFADSPKLRLHELTKPDIHTYVTDRLSKHPRMVDLAQEDAVTMRRLAFQIVRSASGVFLWVKLVVRSLREGLDNFEAPIQLEERLRKLPLDLEKLFMQMLRKIPEGYRVQSSQIFQIIRCHEDASWTTMDLTARDLFYSEFSLNKILIEPTSELSQHELLKMNNEIAGRLRSHCSGLLEVYFMTQPSQAQIKITGRNKEPTQPNPETRVQYIHKTASEFLRKPNVWRQITSWTAGTKFNPYISLVHCYVMRLKTSPFTEDPLIDDDNTYELIDLVMAAAREAERSTSTSQEIVLDHMDKIMTAKFESHREGRYRDEMIEKHKCSEWYSVMMIENRHQMVTPWQTTFLSLAISHDLRLYTENKIRNGLPRNNGRPLLHYVRWEDADPGLVEALLEKSADPNEDFEGDSAFQLAVTAWPRKNVSLWLANIKLLVQHNADVNAYVQSRRIHSSETRVLEESYYRSVLSHLREVVNTSTNKSQINELLTMLEQRGAIDDEYCEADREHDNRIGSKGKEKALIRAPLHVKTWFKRTT